MSITIRAIAATGGTLSLINNAGPIWVADVFQGWGFVVWKTVSLIMAVTLYAIALDNERIK